MVNETREARSVLAVIQIAATAQTATPRGGGMTDRWEMADRLVSLLARRWTLKLLGQLADDGRRYQELHDALDGISHKVLTDTLRRAERNGLLTRHVDPARVETATLCHLTVLGETLAEPLAALDRWSEPNWQHVEGARREWNERRN
jgi:DNA-binding HxlR family transcriptional regulator